MKNGTYIYMTFDDGPNEGTPYVLDALKATGVRASFFINSDNLVEGDKAAIQFNISNTFPTKGWEKLVFSDFQ